MAVLSIQNIHASIEGKEILKGVNLNIKSGELHVLMGPNGSGKSTLAAALLGKPGVNITKGTVTLDGTDILTLKPEDRFKAGLFLAFQNPREIPGVSVFSVLRFASQASAFADRSRLLPTQVGRQAGGALQKSVSALYDEAKKVSVSLGLLPSMMGRALNDGFSGGEKKRAEILQMLVLHPKIAILDEIDSGLDADGVRAIADAIIELRKKEDIGILLITHTARMVHALKPDCVSVMVEGKIIRQGGAEVVEEIECHGYNKFQITNQPSR